MKEVLRWAAGILTGSLLAVVDYIRNGGPVGVKTLLGILVGAIAYRVGSWLVSKYGPVASA